MRFSAPSYRTNAVFSALSFSLIVTQVFLLEKKRKEEERRERKRKEKLSSEGKSLFPFNIPLVTIVSILWFFMRFHYENKTPSLNDQ